MSNPQQLLDEIASGFRRSQILFVALRAGLFELTRTPQRIPEVARALDWHPRSTRMLLDALVAIGLLRRAGDAYANGPEIEACAVAGAPQDQRHILAHNASSYHAWGRLDEAIRTGARIACAPPKRPAEQLRNFILGMADVGRESARQMTGLIDLAPYRRMLDIGGGPASYALAFAAAQPALTATVLDLPEVLPIAQEQIAAAGMTGRVDTAAGDLTKDAFPPGYDLMLVSNIVHMFGEASNRDLVQRCFDALMPGGLLILKDFWMAPDRSGPPFGQVFALNMLLHTDGGDTYTAEEAAAWTDAAGFRPGRMAPLTPHSGLWLVEKAAAHTAEDRA